MKKTMMLLSMGLFVLAISVMTSFAADAAKGKDVTVTGKLTCMSCALTNPANPCGKGCCEKCIKAGDPAMLTDAKGNRYVLLNGEHMQPMMNSERYAMLGGEVTVKGVLVEDKGIHAIFADEITRK